MDPLDELLAAAGIDRSEPRVLAERDGHRVVTEPQPEPTRLLTGGHVPIGFPPGFPLPTVDEAKELTWERWERIAAEAAAAEHRRRYGPQSPTVARLRMKLQRRDHTD